MTSMHVMLNGNNNKNRYKNHGSININNNNRISNRLPRSFTGHGASCWYWYHIVLGHIGNIHIMVISKQGSIKIKLRS